MENTVLMNIKWITDVKQIKTASDESLRRSLITSDGAGKEIKLAALEELINRTINKNMK